MELKQSRGIFESLVRRDSHDIRPSAIAATVALCPESPLACGPGGFLGIGPDLEVGILCRTVSQVLFENVASAVLEEHALPVEHRDQLRVELGSVTAPPAAE